MDYKEIVPNQNDINRLIELSQAWAAENSCYGYVANEADEFNGKRIFVAEDDTGIVGYLFGHAAKAKNMHSLMPAGTPYFEIDELYVLPALRSRGVGKGLFAFAENRLVRDGVPFLVLTTATKDHASVMRFYTEKAGMTPWSATLFKKIQKTEVKTAPQDVRIVPYEEKYRDDMIFTVLAAKNALGRVPRLNPDLLDVPANYFEKGDCFWLALDANDRVVGCVGYNSAENTTEVFLHRLYVKPELKRRGIGTALLETAEEYLKTQGKTAVHVHLGEPKEIWYESYAFYEKHGYREYAPRYMRKNL